MVEKVPLLHEAYRAVNLNNELTFFPSRARSAAEEAVNPG